MTFEPLLAQHFAQLQRVDFFNSYANGLVLLDDLLCSHADIPRFPEYLPANASFKQAGTLELLEEPIDKLINSIGMEELKENLRRNFWLAEELYRERFDMKAEISEFLAALARQYLEIIHPALYPAERPA